MCLALQQLPDGKGPVPCRNCWQCRENRVNDLIGRCIAESQTAANTVAVTLTYSGDHPHAAVLVYPDFQKFVKRLRSAGHSVRYLVAGEYGSKKGRAHWHAILFFDEGGPEIPELDKRVPWSYWTNEAEGRGFCFFQKPDYNGFKYVLKYVLKDDKAQVGIKHIAMSKKPPLGYQYFMNLADEYVQQKLSPQTPVYQFRGVKNSIGKHRRFILQGRMRELFAEAYIIKYRAHHKRDYPFSEFLLEQEDRWYSEAATLSNEQWLALLAHKPIQPPEPDPFIQAQAVQYVAFPYDGDMLLARYPDGRLTLHYGKDEEWQLESVNEISAALGALGVSPSRISETLSKLSFAPKGQP